MDALFVVSDHIEEEATVAMGLTGECGGQEGGPESTIAQQIQSQPHACLRLESERDVQEAALV